MPILLPSIEQFPVLGSNISIINGGSGEVELVQAKTRREDGILAITIRFQYRQKSSSNTHGLELHSVCFSQSLND